MDTAAVDLVLRYALSATAREEWGRRGLGPIHLVKLVYLADLAFAAERGGRTFTGAPWIFHHYGPWCQAVHERVKVVTSAPKVAERVFISSRFENDAHRWEIPDEEAFEEADRRLPIPVSLALKRAVHEHGSITESLLHAVYRTAPMLHAAPEEHLDFRWAVWEKPTPASEPPPKLTRKQEKALDARAAEIRRRLAEQVAAKRKAGQPEGYVAPRYDAVFEEGRAFLDSLAGAPLPQGEGLVEVDPAVWKAAQRSDGELP